VIDIGGSVLLTAPILKPIAHPRNNPPDAHSLTSNGSLRTALGKVSGSTI